MSEFMKDTVDMIKEVEYLELGDVAEGAIQAGPEQQEHVEAFTQDVGAGNFHVETEIKIPCGCIDGRCGCSLKPNTAGGSETLMVADDLTSQQFRAEDESTVGAYKNMVAFMQSINKPIAGHTGPHANTGETSDCGANDKLDKIYDVIARKHDTIRQIVEAHFGFEVTDDDHKLITSRAIERRQFSKGAELLDALRQSGGEVDPLRGDHKEVLAVINKRYGTTLDRQAVEDKYGPNYEAFNIDVWSFEEAARLISSKDAPNEQRAKKVAMAYYNVATAMTLCGPKMRITVLS